MLEKLIGLTTIGSTLAGFTLLQRFLSGVTGVIALTVISAMMCGLLLIGGFIGAYFALTSSGMDALSAAFLIATVAIALTALFISLTIVKARRLRVVSQQSVYRDIPSLSHVGDVISAFIKGLKASRLHSRL